jgi:RimJ/RimL family protein N-acetyltransferase
MTERDVDSLYTIFSDPEVMRYWSSPPFPDREVASKLLSDIHDGFRRRALFQWGIALNSDDTVIGTSTLFHLDENNRRVEIGYALGRLHWGHGYAQEALRALLNFAFAELSLLRIEADVDPRNMASIKTVERLGFRREGYLRERWLVNGELQDSVYYGLLKREWEAQQ